MTIEVKKMPARRVAAVPHVGPYTGISQAFERLDTIANQRGLFDLAGAALLGIFYDDPRSTPPEQLQSAAGITVPDDLVLPDGLEERTLAAGRYACTTHVGPYEQLGTAWQRLMDWLPSNGYQPGPAASYEVYRNTPMNTPPEQLVTELYLPVGSGT